MRIWHPWTHSQNQYAQKPAVKSLISTKFCIIHVCYLLSPSLLLLPKMSVTPNKLKKKLGHFFFFLKSREVSRQSLWGNKFRILTNRLMDLKWHDFDAKLVLNHSETTRNTWVMHFPVCMHISGRSEVKYQIFWCILCAFQQVWYNVDKCPVEPKMHQKSYIPHRNPQECVRKPKTP